MNEDSEPIFDYYIVLPHFHKLQILLVPVEQGWSLPHWELCTLYFWQDVNHVNQRMQEQYALKTSVLRCLSSAYDPTTHHIQRMYELENHSAKWQPPELARWIGQDQLTDVQFPFPEQQRIINAWFAENRDHFSSPLKMPWAERGWMMKAQGWIQSQLTMLGLIAIAPIEQLRVWERSTLLRVRTHRGNIYFKAIPEIFSHEIPLTKLISSIAPQSSPTLLAVDIKHHWMLMQDFGGTPLQQNHHPEQWEQAMQQFASLQIKLSGQVNNLLNSGSHYRPLDLLASQVEPMIATLPTITPSQRGDLTDEDISQLIALIPQLVKLCQNLAQFNIPYSLEHGDLWATNIVVTDHNFIFFDWSDASITHPFFSLLLILESLSDMPLNVCAAQKRICDTYLQPWIDHEDASSELLQKAFELAICLAPLHYAATYYQTIIPAIGAKWELERMFPFYLKMLLHNIQEYCS